MSLENSLSAQVRDVGVVVDYSTNCGDDESRRVVVAKICFAISL